MGDYHGTNHFSRRGTPNGYWQHRYREMTKTGDTPPTSIGQAVQRARIAAGKTQAKLGEEAEIGRSLLAAMERDQRRISGWRWTKLVKALPALDDLKIRLTRGREGNYVLLDQPPA